jgi:hypothetical protein
MYVIVSTELAEINIDAQASVSLVVRLDENGP